MFRNTLLADEIKKVDTFAEIVFEKEKYY